MDAKLFSWGISMDLKKAFDTVDHGISLLIKFSTSNNGFRVLWLVHSILVISSYNLVWPYMVNDCAKLKMFSPESDIFLWIKPKKKKNLFVESLDQCRRLEVRKKARNVFLWWAYVYVTTRCYTTSHLQVFFDFARIFSHFSLVFRASNFWSLRNFIKQFHSRLLDMRLAMYHLISNARSWNNC